MNRQQGQPAQYYQTASNQYSDYSYPSQGRKSEQGQKSQQGELVVFNGSQHERNIYQFNEKKSLDVQQNYAALPRTNSQKAYPIIYNSFNQHRGHLQNPTHLKISLNSLNPLNSPESHPKSYQPPSFQSNYQMPTYHQSSSYQLPKDPLFQPLHSDVFLYADNNPKNQHTEDHERHQFHTFQQIPAEPQTANFLQIPSEHSSDLGEHKQGSNPVKQTTLVYRQQLNSLPLHVLPREPEKAFVVNQSLQQQIVRPANRIFTNSLPPPSPRANIQSSKHNFISATQQRARVVQVPQEEYQRYMEHMTSCRGSQEEVSALRVKNQQLSSKERFYWEENNTLRDENTRLRDLVTQFQKREKELLRERQELRSSLLQNINKYQQSTVQEMGLLLERYRLELQKKK